MFKLDQHIEFLLLKHDCVIVPGFGGFVVHHIASRFDDSDAMMLPPKFMVGFNQQLTLNDSLLVQSYIDAYDLSYPEALRAVEADTEELRHRIEDYGSFDIRSIGRLLLNAEGVYEFEPNESGILAPSLFALTGIDMTDPTLFLTAEDKKKEPALQVYRSESNVEEEDDEDITEDERFIRINKVTLRNVAAACAAIILLLCLPLLKNNPQTNKILSSIDTSFLSQLHVNDLIKKEMPTERKVYHVYVNKAKKADITEQAESTAEESKTEPFFTVVLAARITQTNAEFYAQKLTKQGLKDVRVIGEGKERKVVCGTFKTEEEAQNLRRDLYFEQTEFENAWVTEIK